MKRKLVSFIMGAAVVCTAALSFGGCGSADKIKDFHTAAFGENVYIFSPEDDPVTVQKTIDEIYEKQEANQFGDDRYSLYFLPGDYDDSIQLSMGFYTQMAGLGALPTDTKINHFECLARWLEPGSDNNNACCNFWRSVENMEFETNTTWAVSQATDMRRMQIDASIYLHDDYGWCSGGFLADSNVDAMIDSGSQQQWLSRNNTYRLWMGENWNMVFAGDSEESTPTGTWPVKAYTISDADTNVREKPFLTYDEKQGFGVFVPAFHDKLKGTTWQSDNAGEWLSIKDFYIAKPGDSADAINKALESGKHLFMTPGIYELDSPILVKKANTIVLGTGLATLKAVNGNSCMELSDEDGIIVAGLLFDAGEKESEYLLKVGENKSISHETNPISLSDLFFRVGGTPTANPCRTKSCVVINSSNVVGDNFWVWRADHGDQVAWDLNTAANGIIVNGDNVTIYALMVEHFQEYQTVWNGNGGRVVMYQSEIPYDVPSQDAWCEDGYGSFYVSDGAEDFYATGLGIYLYNRDATVKLKSPMEIPDKDGVKVHNLKTVMITGNPGMQYVINEAGDSALSAGKVSMIINYENGEYK